MKLQPGSLASGILLAGLAAGPLFVTLIMLTHILAQPGAALKIGVVEVAGFAAALLPATIVGALIGLPVNALGSGLLMKLGEWTALAHPRLSWTIAGGLIGLAAGLLMGMTEAPPALIALILTCAICARICRKDVVWMDENGEELPNDN